MLGKRASRTEGEKQECFDGDNPKFSNRKEKKGFDKEQTQNTNNVSTRKCEYAIIMCPKLSQ